MTAPNAPASEGGTPRVDEHLKERYGEHTRCYVMRTYEHMLVDSEFARTLERELDALRTQVGAFEIAACCPDEQNCKWRNPPARTEGLPDHLDDCALALYSHAACSCNYEERLRARCEELAGERDRAYSMLEANGVPRERAKSVANGIDVLVTRFCKYEQSAERQLAEAASVEDVRDFIFRKLVAMGRDEAASTIRHMDLSQLAALSRWVPVWERLPEVNMTTEEITRIRNLGCGNEWPKVWNRQLTQLCDAAQFVIDAARELPPPPEK